MRDYFLPSKPVYSCFKRLDRVAQGLGVSSQTGEVCHLDIVQEAICPAWTRLLAIEPVEAKALRSADAPFLRWQPTAFPPGWVVCNGRTPLDAVLDLYWGQDRANGIDVATLLL